MNKLWFPLTCAFSGPLLAQGTETLPGPAPDLASILTQWQAAHGSEWHLWADPTTRHAEILFGGSAQASTLPSTNVAADWFALGRQWISEHGAMLGIGTDELVDVRVSFLPLGTGNGTDKMTVRFEQRLGNLVVENGVVNFLFNTKGTLLSVHNTTSPWLEGLPTVPGIALGSVQAAVGARFSDETGFAATSLEEPTLFVAQVVRDGIRRPYLAYRTTALYERDGEEPAGFTYITDAFTGVTLRRDEAIHHFDVTGQVRTLATPGLNADSAGNPATSQPAPYIRVSSSAGTVTADRNGNFTFPGVNTPLDITVTYLGMYNNVNHNTGTDYTVTFNQVPANQPNTLLMNPAPVQQTTSQANGYIHINTVGDYIRDNFPGDTHANFVATTNVNQNDTCNAFFNGNSTNYFLAGGGCNNTAFSTVVAHEFGHWLNVQYGTGNGADGMGEGNADVWAMYTFGTPVVGANFFTSGGFIRTGNNTRQFCGDNNGGCYGGVHADGEVWMGAAWKIRSRLVTSLGASLGAQTATNLFLGWMNGYNQTQIKSIIEVQWLTLDDNDGNINNGTPNYDDINDGFLAQGFPGFDLEFLSFQGVTQLPNVPSDMGPYTVNATVTATFNPPIVNPTLFWRAGAGSFTSVPMSNTSGNNYSAQIPAQPGLQGFVQYYLSAADSQGNVEQFPTEGANAPLEFSIAQVVIASYDFEAAGAEGWSIGTPNNATTGTWVRLNPNGTAAQSEDDHTPGAGAQCWFTGQGSVGGAVGDADVDGGTTTLLSPVWDLSNVGEPTISYWRWYSNNQGGAPNSDTFVIGISNDGGTTWTTAETVGPAGAQAGGGWFQRTLDVAALVTPTANMRLRFQASDLGTGSIVEAMLDDVRVFGFGSVCPAPTNYCTSTPNSGGTAAVMSAGGSQNVNVNNFQLAVSGARAGQFGLFFYGNQQVFIPTGNGFLCVGGNTFRLAPQLVDALGTAVKQLDFTMPPFPSGTITNGSTWYFSFWYRDPFVGANYNFADGLRVEFCN